jgi:CRP/FNR family transcriptional regulator
LGLEVLGGSAYAHTAVALRTTNLCEIPISVIDEMSEHNRDVIRGVMRKWNDQMAAADISITRLNSGPVTERLVELVRLIAEISGDRTDAVELPSVADMASLVGSSPEGVSRHMAELKRAGILTRLAPRIYRCDELFDGSAGVSIRHAEKPLPSRPVNVDSTSLN